MKKKCIYVFIGLLISTNVFGQYESIFGDSATVWNVFFLHQISHGSPCEAVEFQTNMVRINDTIFYKVDYFLFREDSMSGKLWRREISGTEEKLIMDMSLEEGDTLFLDNMYYSNGVLSEPFFCDMAIIDSIFINEDGLKVQVAGNCVNSLFCDNHTEQLRFIEGTGPSFSLLYGLEFFSPNHLICQHKDSQEIYYNSHFSSCNPIWTKSEKTNEFDEISIMPNPASNKVWIHLNTESDFLLEISNTLLTIKQTRYLKKKDIEIDISKYEQGMYFFKITNKEYERTFSIIKL